MAKAKSEPLAGAEWKVMRIIWQHKSCAAREVYQEAAREHGWAPSTTKTLLRRLVEKGYLQARQVGNSFLYRPAQPAIKTLTGAADTLLGNALDGLVGPLLAHMVKTSSLSAEDLAQLKALLDEHAPQDYDP